jgi:hypothetical protein
LQSVTVEATANTNRMGPVMDDLPLDLSAREIAAAFSDPQWAQKFPPLLNIEEAAELLKTPVGTLRDWRSRGLLSNCSRRVGKRVKFFRDRLVREVFNSRAQ